MVNDNPKIGTFQKCDLKSSQPKIGKQTSTNKHGNKHGAGVARGGVWGGDDVTQCYDPVLVVFNQSEFEMLSTFSNQPIKTSNPNNQSNRAKSANPNNQSNRAILLVT